jgi:hypothetical protein
MFVGAAIRKKLALPTRPTDESPEDTSVPGTTLTARAAYGTSPSHP